MVTLSWDSLKLTLHSTYSYWQIICWNKTPISTMSKFLITKRLGGSLVLVPRLPSTSPLSPSSSWRNAIQLCDIVSTRYPAPCPQASARKEQKKGTKRKLFRFPNERIIQVLNLVFLMVRKVLAESMTLLGIS